MGQAGARGASLVQIPDTCFRAHGAATCMDTSSRLHRAEFVLIQAYSPAVDMWSVGVVILELILGSPHVFQISDRTRALLDQHLEGWSEHTKELAYR